MSDHIRTLFAAYLDGELTASERRAVEDALRTDPALRAELEQLKTLRERTITALHAQAAEAKAPPDAFARLQQRLSEQHTPQPLEGPPAHLNGGRPQMYRNERTTQSKRVPWLHVVTLGAVASMTAIIAAVLIIGRATRAEVISADAPPAEAPITEGSDAIATPEAAEEIEPAVEEAAEDLALQDFMLQWGYVPESFYAQNAIGHIMNDGQAINEYRYNSNDQFVIVTEATSSDEPLPPGDVLVVQGGPAILQTGLSGTAELTLEHSRLGAPDPSTVVGGGGGGGGDDSSPDATYPDQIAYENGLRIIWDDGIRRVDVLTNLGTNEAMRVIEGLRWEPLPESAPSLVGENGLDLPNAPSNARVEVRSDYNISLVEGFFHSAALDVWDETEGHINERRFNSSDEFVIVTRRLADEGETTAQGSFLVRGQPALLSEGLSGTANITLPLLQDGIERGVLGMGSGGYTGEGDDAQTPPETIAYENGLQVEWVEEGVYWTVLSNLPQADVVAFVEAMSIEPLPEDDPNATTLDGLSFEVVLPSYVPEGMRLLENGPFALGTGANFAYFSEDGRKISVRQFAMDTAVTPQGYSETVDIAGQTGYVYPGEDVTTQLANGATITILDGTTILFDLQPGVRVTMTTTLPLEEAILVAESMLNQ